MSRTLFLRNSEIQNLTSNKVNSVIMYIDEHAAHLSGHKVNGGVGNGNLK